MRASPASIPGLGKLNLAQKVLPVCYFFKSMRLGTKYTGN